MCLQYLELGPYHIHVEREQITGIGILHHHTQCLLLAAAADLLDEGGPAAVTFRAVGKKVGLSQKAAFKLFRAKEPILAAIASRELSRQAASLKAPAASKNPLDELKRRLHGYVGWALRLPARLHLTFGRWEGDYPELAEAATEARLQLVDLVRAAQGRKQMAPGDPDRSVSLLLAIAHGAASLALNGHLEKPGKSVAKPGDTIDDLLVALNQ